MEVRFLARVRNWKPVAKKEKPVAEEVEDVPVADDTLEVLAVAVDLPVEGDAGPIAAKRSIGPKEPIPFKWKIVGMADRYILTLFKSVEREDADAQLDRLTKEGYYTDLRITDINEKIEQPVQKETKKAKAAKKELAEKPEKTDRTVKSAKGAREEKSVVRLVRAKLAVKSGKSSKSDKPAAKAPKSAKKKSSGGKTAKTDSRRR